LAPLKYTPGVRIPELRTPCVLIEQTRVERNIDRMQAVADSRAKRLRPHAKTHKSPDFALIQIARGAIGICCAKLGEAEVFADHRVEDIRIPYPLNPVNGDRVLALLDRTRLSFIVDHLDVARGWSGVLSAAGREADVLVKVDVGFRRCGIDPDARDAPDFVARVAEMRGLRFKGFVSHAGHAYAATSEQQISAIADAEARTLTTLRDRVADKGILVQEISVGATPTARFSARLQGITELRTGNYIYYDRMQVAIGSATWDDCALTVLAQVVARPAPDRLIFDSGSKTLTSDLARGQGNTAGYGAVLQALHAVTPDERLVIERLSEEHATVRIEGECALAPGDLVRIVPNHSCVVSNLVDEAWVVDGDNVTDRLRIAARGRIT
jgi:D-serine deaminase-like pyridoxal phosphate-dependent protein